jgi:hypothetical protein
MAAEQDTATKKAATGLAVAAIGGLVSWYGPSLAADDKTKGTVRISGLVVVAAGAFVFLRSIADAIEEMKTEAQTSGGLFGAFGKLVFGQRPAGEIVTREETSIPAAALGEPKNRIGLVGAIISPLDGESVSRQLFSDTYEIKVAIANRGDEPVSSAVRVTVHEESALTSGDSSADSSVVTFDPDAHQQVLTLRVPAALGVTLPFDSIDITARLYVAGYLLHKSNFQRE